MTLRVLRQPDFIVNSPFGAFTTCVKNFIRYSDTVCVHNKLLTRYFQSFVPKLELTRQNVRDKMHLRMGA